MLWAGKECGIFQKGKKDPVAKISWSKDESDSNLDHKEGIVALKVIFYIF